MKTLYDVLGVRPDDDAESLKRAYRKAARANHPDHHAGDPEAAARFTKIAAAYDILRDAGRRAAYDRRLEQRHKPLRSKFKRTVSELRRHIVTDAITAVAVTVLLIGGCMLFTRISGTSIDEAQDITARKAVQTAAVAGQDGTAEHGLSWPERVAAPQIPTAMPLMVSGGAANGRGAGHETKDQQPAADPPRPAQRDDDSDRAASRADGKGVTGVPLKNNRLALVERDEPQSAEFQISGPDRHGDGRKPHGPNVVVSGGRRNARTPEPADTNTGDARLQPAMKRPAASHPAVEQAALENRDVSRCPGSHSCYGDIPSIFGLGF